MNERERLGIVQALYAEIVRQQQLQVQVATTRHLSLLTQSWNDLFHHIITLTIQLGVTHPLAKHEVLISIL
jgi:hypothetical protein